ncbi:MAG: hypothetical protein WA999_16670, partial [Spirulinaceae cyanobacterium]
YPVLVNLSELPGVSVISEALLNSEAEEQGVVSSPLPPIEEIEEVEELEIETTKGSLPKGLAILLGVIAILTIVGIAGFATKWFLDSLEKQDNSDSSPDVENIETP